uniref:Uncharacterized protein n=1 Tax=viral metagenome TaxID=1070528 RepID=A0A6M3M8A3_9ZZZZ
MARVAVPLSLQEVDRMIADIEARGGDAEELKKMRAQISNGKWLEKHPKPPSEEEYIAKLRSESTIEHGTDLECMICHGKFGHLISGTCEKCWRAWMLGTKR